MTQISVYTASKTSLADFWLALRKDPQWSHVHFTARWPSYLLGGQIPDTQAFCQVTWVHDESDIYHSDVVLVVATTGESLRGALVEAGIGLAYDKQIIIVGDHHDYGTWQFHPQVMKAPTLEDARRLLELMCGMEYQGGTPIRRAH